MALSLTHSDHSILQPSATHRSGGLLVAILALDEVGIGELQWQLVVDAVVRPAASRLHNVIFGSTGAFKSRAEVEEDLFVQVVTEAIHHCAPPCRLELGQMLTHGIGMGLQIVLGRCAASCPLRQLALALVEISDKPSGKLCQHQGAADAFGRNRDSHSLAGHHFIVLAQRLQTDALQPIQSHLFEFLQPYLALHQLDERRVADDVVDRLLASGGHCLEGGKGVVGHAGNGQAGDLAVEHAGLRTIEGIGCAALHDVPAHMRDESIAGVGVHVGSAVGAFVKLATGDDTYILVERLSAVSCSHVGFLHEGIAHIAFGIFQPNQQHRRRSSGREFEDAGMGVLGLFLGIALEATLFLIDAFLLNFDGLLFAPGLHPKLVNLVDLRLARARGAHHEALQIERLGFFVANGESNAVGQDSDHGTRGDDDGHRLAVGEGFERFAKSGRQLAAFAGRKAPHA